MTLWPKFLRTRRRRSWEAVDLLLETCFAGAARPISALFALGAKVRAACGERPWMAWVRDCMFTACGVFTCRSIIVRRERCAKAQTRLPRCGHGWLPLPSGSGAVNGILTLVLCPFARCPLLAGARRPPLLRPRSHASMPSGRGPLKPQALHTPGSLQQPYSESLTSSVARCLLLRRGVAAAPTQVSGRRAPLGPGSLGAAGEIDGFDLGCWWELLDATCSTSSGSGEIGCDAEGEQLEWRRRASGVFCRDCVAVGSQDVEVL